MSDNNSTATIETATEAKHVGKQPKIAQEAFVSAWQGSESIDAFVQQFPTLASMDAKKARLYSSIRASNLRKQGVSLKTFRRGRKARATTVVAE